MLPIIPIINCRHENRQAEPKDYDISTAPVRDLLKSTYKHLVTAADVSTLQLSCSHVLQFLSKIGVLQYVLQLIHLL